MQIQRFIICWGFLEKNKLQNGKHEIARDKYQY